MSATEDDLEDSEIQVACLGSLVRWRRRRQARSDSKRKVDDWRRSIETNTDYRVITSGLPQEIVVERVD